MSAGARAWIGFTAMALGMFLAILDIQIVASSLVDIQVDLRIPPGRLSYLQTSYLIAEVIAIAVTGWMTRALSIRWLFAGALVGFVAASAACAAAPGYGALYAFRFVQGLFGGVLIPTVFSAALLMFPRERQTLAMVIGGGLATLAPTLGPFVGGWITETLSWHWLFLINIAPGLLAAAAVAATVRIDVPDFAALRRLDWASLGLAAAALAAMELTLKEAPRLGWTAPASLALASVCVGCGVAVVRRCRGRAEPLIDVAVFADRGFALGAFYSFVLGMALYGATYLLPLFLGIVRAHGPLETGTVMVVTGAAQLATSPLAAALERRVEARRLAALGYALFAAGLLLNARATPAWDFRELALPQVLRGAALLLCLLPTTRLALGQLPPERLAQGSSLFNLMRNVGGAVGLAVIDTVIELRPAHHVAAIVARLQAGDRATAAFVGLPLERFHGVPLPPVDAITREALEPLVNAAAATASFNEAWLLLGGLCVLALGALPFMKPAPPAPHSPHAGAT
jgi:DHA2 family multidrug resistance protein